MNKKVIGLVLGLVLLAGSAGVVGLTVFRTVDLRTVLQRPKANGLDWPACANAPGASYTCHNGDNCYIDGGSDNQNITKCCDKIKSTGDPFQCQWPARGWCRPDQCPSSGGQMCGLYTFNSSSGCTYLTGSSCTSDFNCSSGKVCQNGSCVVAAPPGCPNPYKPNNGNPQGQISSTTPDFSWSWCASDKINWANVYLYDRQPGAGVSAIAQAGGAGTNKDSASFASFSTTLQPNKQYFWQLNPNSCASYPSTNCPVGSGPDVWNFTTGSGGTACNRCSTTNGCERVQFTNPSGQCNTPDSGVTVTRTTDASCGQVSGGDNSRCGVAKTCSVSLDKTSMTTSDSVNVTSSGTGGRVNTIISRTDSGPIDQI